MAITFLISGYSLTKIWRKIRFFFSPNILVLRKFGKKSYFSQNFPIFFVSVHIQISPSCSTKSHREMGGTQGSVSGHLLVGSGRSTLEPDKG